MINEQIVGQLSPLWQVFARRFQEKDEAFNYQNGKMHRMRQPKVMERWEKESVLARAEDASIYKLESANKSLFR
jgi:hypothetical protein